MCNTTQAKTTAGTLLNLKSSFFNRQHHLPPTCQSAAKVFNHHPALAVTVIVLLLTANQTPSVSIQLHQPGSSGYVGSLRFTNGTCTIVETKQEVHTYMGIICMNVLPVAHTVCAKKNFPCMFRFTIDCLMKTEVKRLLNGY